MRGGGKLLGGEDDGFTMSCSVSITSCSEENANGAKQRNDAGFPVTEITSLLVLDLVTRDPQRIEGASDAADPNGRPTTHSSKEENGQGNRQKRADDSGRTEAKMRRLRK